MRTAPINVPLFRDPDSKVVSPEWVLWLEEVAAALSNTVPEAPADGNKYVRKDGAWVVA